MGSAQAGDDPAKRTLRISLIPVVPRLLPLFQRMEGEPGFKTAAMETSSRRADVLATLISSEAISPGFPHFGPRTLLSGAHQLDDGEAGEMIAVAKLDSFSIVPNTTTVGLAKPILHFVESLGLEDEIVR